MKDFAKSIRTGNSKVENEDNSDIIRAAKKLLEDAKKFGWAELGYNGWTKKDVEHLEKRIKELEQKQRTGNSKVGNYSVTAETAASTMTKEEFDGVIKAFKEELERAKRDGRKDSVKAYEDALKRAMELKKKYIGNSKVGNLSVGDTGKVEINRDLHKVKIISIDGKWARIQFLDGPLKGQTDEELIEKIRTGNSKVGNAQKLYSDANVEIYDDGIVKLTQFPGYTQWAKDVDSIIRDEIRSLEKQISDLKNAASKVKEVGKKYGLL